MQEYTKADIPAFYIRKTITHICRNIYSHYACC